MKVVKKPFNRPNWLIVAIILLNVVIAVFSAAIEPPEEGHHHHTDHNDHNHDHDESGEQEASAEQAEASIKGYGEDCSGSGTKCNENHGLICYKDLGKCECPLGSVFSTDSEKCQDAPGSPTHDYPSNDFFEDDEHEDHHDHAEPEDPTTTTSASISTSPKTEEEHHDHEVHEEANVDNDDHDDHADDDDKHVVNKCENVDCNKDFGKYSKCDENTGECICHDVDGQNRPVELVSGKCWIERKINDPCASHEECSATIKGKAWCHMDSETMKRFCQCEMFHYFDDNQKECLPFAQDGLFSSCKTDFQCTGFESTPTGHGLGPNARCSENSGVCECKLGPSGEKGFLYENYCYHHLKIGDQCTFNGECEVSDQDTFCSDETKTCSPKPIDLDGRRMEDGQAEATSSSENEGLIDTLKSAIGIEMPNFVFIMIIGAVVLLVIVIISVFILKKRHKYAMVRTRDTPGPNHM